MSSNVSILARPEGRALHPLMIAAASACLFQSSPAPKDGRYRLRLQMPALRYGFNPRPPRRTGATLATFSMDWAIVVSILARPEGRALLYSCNCMIAVKFLCRTREPRSRPERKVTDETVLHECFHYFSMLRLARTCRDFAAARGARFHITSGPSKSVALKLPYSFTCSSAGSVSR